MNRPPRLLIALLVSVGVGAAGVARAADPTGDPARGRGIFEAKGCARCHVPLGQGAGVGVGPPLEVVRRPQGVIELAGRLWNHAPGMFGLFKREGLTWPDLTPEQMADLMTYLQAERRRDPPPDRFRGQIVLVHKGCLKCHRLRGEGGSVAIELTTYQGGYESPLAWATTIWNHAPRMAGLAAALGVLYPRFAGDEMGHLVEFLRSTAAAAPR